MGWNWWWIGSGGGLWAKMNLNRGDTLCLWWYWVPGIFARWGPNGPGGGGIQTRWVWCRGKKYIFYYHRILGECFIKNSNNFTTIDHIDRNPKNNDLSNLRFASRNLQQINRNIRTDNTTGTKGVIFDKCHNRYIASWSVNNKHFTKSFSINKYGKDAKQLAIDYRAKMVEKHYKNIK